MTAPLSAADIRATRFRRPPFGKRGYDPAEVDAFLDEAAAALDLRARGLRPDLRADGVHTVSFHKPPFGKRGYDEQEVDDLLDAVEAALR